MWMYLFIFRYHNLWFSCKFSMGYWQKTKTKEARKSDEYFDGYFFIFWCHFIHQIVFPISNVHNNKLTQHIHTLPLSLSLKCLQRCLLIIMDYKSTTDPSFYFVLSAAPQPLFNPYPAHINKAHPAFNTALFKPLKLSVG